MPKAFTEMPFVKRHRGIGIDNFNLYTSKASRFPCPVTDGLVAVGNRVPRTLLTIAPSSKISMTCFDEI